jgi:chromosome segregation ATPase
MAKDWISLRAEIEDLRSQLAAESERRESAERERDEALAACNRHTDEIIKLLEAIEEHEQIVALDEDLVRRDETLYAVAASIKRPAQVKDAEHG